MNRFESMFDDTLMPKERIIDWSPSFNLGVLWRKDKDWSFGAVFKSSQNVKGNALGTPVDVDLPETWGVGVAYHPSDKIRILADIDYINWSEFDSKPDDDLVRGNVTRIHLGGEWRDQCAARKHAQLQWTDAVDRFADPRWQGYRS